MKWIFAMILGLGATGYLLGLFDNVTPQKIQLYVRSFGVFAPLIFITLFSVAPLVPFFNAVLAMAGGLIFGFVMGSGLVMLGALCGGTVGFYVARTCGKWLHRHKAYARYNDSLRQAMHYNGFLIIFLLRLIPLVPYDIISYGAGLSGIKFRTYILATALGIIPGILVYVNIGASSLDIRSRWFYISLSLLVLLSVLSLVLKGTLQTKLTAKGGTNHPTRPFKVDDP